MASRTLIALASNSLTHEPMSSTDTVPVAAVPVSAGSGNLIEKRSDGIYYGIQAPADITNIYVDSTNGSDSTGKGTKALPYKTLQKAFNVVSATQSNTIHLKAGGSYEWVSSSVNGCIRTITVYGDPYIDGDKRPSITPSNPWYYWYGTEKVNRPTIYSRCRYTTSNGYYDMYSVTVSNAGGLKIYGCILDLLPTNYPGTLDAPAVPSGASAWRSGHLSNMFTKSGATVSLYGCVINRTTGNVSGQPTNPLINKTLDGDFANLQLLRCIINTQTSLFVVGAGSAIFDAPNYGSNHDNWVNEDPEANARLISNSTTQLKSGKVVGGINRSANLAGNKPGVPLNVSCNIVL